ncbi:aminotransferase class V-fold PLP-dependent enzyme [uncultured Williamsia sp.]|uniref:kynureninase n=1 Tax=uncultured Williamsia sp. TaxID=259311 RepID=UPI00262C18B3|nr:aminotransferase class V-fold PLP-dependent enzyme [uncultured Williamsia sp.]
MTRPTADDLDAADALAEFRAQFVDGDGVLAYLDGNSLGRPLKVTADHMREFIEHEWGGRLIRGWDERWLDLPTGLGDRLGAAVLGAAPGQTVVADSTSVLIYKLARAALAMRPNRSEIVIDRDNFPTDRYLVEGIAAETGTTIRWIDTDHDGGVTVDLLDEAVSDRTALVLVSHVAYRSGYLLDAPGVTQLIHDRGALLLLDVSHSVGSVPMQLDAWGVDFAAGCSYKYLNGGPGAPAFAYVRQGLVDDVAQPIWGWLGAADPFEMGQGYVPGPGVRRLLSGTPPILGMLPIADMLDLIERAGIDAIRTKSVALTELAITLSESVLRPLGATLASPRDPDRRGGHITVDHPNSRQAVTRLWRQGVIPDFRTPDGVRLGFSPLTTSFDEVERGIEALALALG